MPIEYRPGVPPQRRPDYLYETGQRTKTKHEKAMEIIDAHDFRGGRYELRSWGPGDGSTYSQCFGAGKQPKFFASFSDERMDFMGLLSVLEFSGDYEVWDTKLGRKTTHYEPTWVDAPEVKRANK